MRVLHLAPLWHPIKKDAPGGIETFLAELLCALDDLGYENTVIAAGDSEVCGEVIPALETSLCGQMKAGSAFEYTYYEQQQLCLALAFGEKFDFVHSHVGPGAYLLSSVNTLKNRVLHTHHGPVYGDLKWFLDRHPDLWLSTVSESQLRKLGRQNGARRRLIYNGIDLRQFTFSAESEGELLFLGRIERAKGPDLAVEVARKLDIPLRLAGPILDWPFFRETIQPHLNGKIQYVGVVNHAEKTELFGHADCLLMPSRWEEPFGLVAIESMACGTPVVALANGALPEIVECGRTGFVTDAAPSLPELVQRATTLDRTAVRSRVAERFDIGRVADAYGALYDEIARSG
jgi:glycosyltransferase involved in cell wall biosynthesis